MCVIALVFIGVWVGTDGASNTDPKLWYLAPPLNAHIRITDFLATAAAALVLPYFYSKAPILSAVRTTALLLATSVVWGLLFWCGGRGGIISAFFVLAILPCILKLKKTPIPRGTLLIVLAVGMGALLAKLFAVYPWNGLGGATQRTIRSSTNLYSLSNSRCDYWLTVWESLRETNSFILGLGSQGYCYMPNRIYAFQPHNLVFQFLAEWGVLGTVLFLSMLIYGFFVGIKKYLLSRSGNVPVPVLAAFCIILSLGVHSLVDGIFYHAQSSMYMAIAFAVWMKAPNNPK